MEDAMRKNILGIAVFMYVFVVATTFTSWLRPTQAKVRISNTIRVHMLDCDGKVRVMEASRLNSREVKALEVWASGDGKIVGTTIGDGNQVRPPAR
jgi:hypothetical protein